MSNILLGITGGIAAYKSCSLTRALVKRGHDVKVIMTENACKFVGKATFETLSGNEVCTSLWNDRVDTKHISLADWGDMLIVAPATANIIGKYASGIADDMLSTELLSFPGNVLIVPAMNDRMYAHPAVQDNIELLRKRNVRVMEPSAGPLACGTEGKGRMPDEADILLETERLLEKGDKLRGREVIVTAGALMEHFDPVRVMTNLSSGKMGAAFAEAAYALKAESVTVIHGRMDSRLPGLIHAEYAPDAEAMKETLERNVHADNVLIMCAAVSDFKPVFSEEKLKREESFKPEFNPNPDIIASVKRKGLIKIGFALETENAVENGRKKMESKDLDYIVVNNPGNIGADDGEVTVLSRNGKSLKLERMDKKSIALKVLEWIEL